MTPSALEIRVQDIDHCGIVAGIIDQMCLVEQINQILEHRFINEETRPKSSLQRVKSEGENRAEAYYTMIVDISKVTHKFNQLSRKSAFVVQVYSV